MRSINKGGFGGGGPHFLKKINTSSITTQLWVKELASLIGS